MGQEERRNKAKLEKTQITVATSNTEYENAVKALEDTTVRWNREWKAASDKFQDLEEERLDFTKSSLWTFANIASTVCVSDDSSCEKIRLSLEKMDVEKDISIFISERGTGQEIPDAPKYINFCRGDLNDTASEASDEDNYSVAQFPRSINPAFRSSSPQPSTFESHHDPNSELAKNFAQRDAVPATSREPTLTPQKQQMVQHSQQVSQLQHSQMQQSQMQPHQPQHVQTQHHQMQHPRGSMEETYRQRPQPPQLSYDAREHGPVASVPHDPYPLDGMTMLCRTGPLGPPSDRSSQLTSARRSSRDEHSEYSNPTSLSSVEAPSPQVSPTKQDPEPYPSPDRSVQKKKSGFFQNHSPFRRKSMKDGQAGNRNTWHVPSSQSGSPTRRPQLYNQDPPTKTLLQDERTASPEPIDANASLALGVGQNVLPVTKSDDRRGGSQPAPRQEVDESDPIAMALAELKGINLGKGSSVDKQGSIRVSADQYHGMATPAPPGSHDRAASTRGTPPPSYQQQTATPVSRLGVPPPAVTSKAMKQATEKVMNQTRSVFGAEGRDGGRDGVRGGGRDGGREGGRTYGSSTGSYSRNSGPSRSRAASPAIARSASPQPQRGNDQRRMDHRSASPNPYGGNHHRNSSQTSFQQPQQRGSDRGFYRDSSPAQSVRGQSPAFNREFGNGRPKSSYGGSDMAVQLAPVDDDGYGSQRSRTGRPENRAMGLYQEGRPRSKSVADPSRQYTPDGKPILHFGKFRHLLYDDGFF